MLRRRPDDSFELRYIEHALRAISAPPLSSERKAVLLDRIMSNLGDQDAPRSFARTIATERWILVPAGIGIIGTILATAIAAERLVADTSDGSSSPLSGGLVAVQPANPGHYIATADQWVRFRNDVAVGIEEGSEIRYDTVDGVTAVRLLSGHCTVVTRNARTMVTGAGFSIELDENSIVRVETLERGSRITAMLGVSRVTSAGLSIALAAGQSIEVPMLPPAAVDGETPATPGSNIVPTGGQTNPSGGPLPDGGSGHGAEPGSPSGGPGPSDSVPSSNPASPNPPASSPDGAPSGAVPATPAAPPETIPAEPATPPDPPGAAGQGNGSANGNGGTGGNGHANGNGEPGANGPANGNGEPGANGQANGNGEPGANGAVNGNGNGPAAGNGEQGGKGAAAGTGEPGSAGQAAGGGEPNGNGQPNGNAQANGNGPSAGASGAANGNGPATAANGQANGNGPAAAANEQANGSGPAAAANGQAGNGKGSAKS